MGLFEKKASQGLIEPLWIKTGTYRSQCTGIKFSETNGEKQPVSTFTFLPRSPVEGGTDIADVFRDDMLSVPTVELSLDLNEWDEYNVYVGLVGVPVEVDGKVVMRDGQKVDAAWNDTGKTYSRLLHWSAETTADKFKCEGFVEVQIKSLPPKLNPTGTGYYPAKYDVKDLGAEGESQARTQAGLAAIMKRVKPTGAAAAASAVPKKK